MSPAVEVFKLDAREKEHLRNLLNYTEQHPEGWTPRPDGMHEYYHKGIQPIIQPLIQVVCILISLYR